LSGRVFHKLRVTEVAPLTDDSAAVTLAVPADLRDEFAYLPGQHVTVRAVVGGRDVRRPYSICADAASGKLRLAIKRIPGGVFSTYATTELKAGDELEAAAPTGDFTIEIDPSKPRRAAAIAAGSGITPVLSLISTSLESEPEASWTLLYGNKTVADIMFLEELEGLKDRHPGRFQLIHLLSREGADAPLLSGRIDAEKIAAVHSDLLGGAPVGEWFLCGPRDMTTAAEEALRGLGADEGAVRVELFHSGPVDASTLPPEPPEGEGSVDLTVIFDGRAVSARTAPETSILDAALRVRPEIPYSCRSGMCATCRAVVEEGEVTMVRNHALIDSEVEAGQILTCQSHPAPGKVVVRYDRR